MAAAQQQRPLKPGWAGWAALIGVPVAVAGIVGFVAWSPLAPESCRDLAGRATLDAIDVGSCVDRNDRTVDVSVSAAECRGEHTGRTLWWGEHGWGLDDGQWTAAPFADAPGDIWDACWPN